jgi:hypothetical protein
MKSFWPGKITTELKLFISCKFFHPKAGLKRFVIIDKESPLCTVYNCPSQSGIRKTVPTFIEEIFLIALTLNIVSFDKL